MRVAIVLNSPKAIKQVCEDYVIYTDGGYTNKQYLSDKKTLAVIGDFDTLKEIPKGENIVRLEKEKNFTDGERAVYFAKESGATEVVIYGGLEGKIEHILGNISLLKIAYNLNIKARIEEEQCFIIYAKGKTEIKTDIKKSLSIIPYSNKCRVKNSCGLYYPLKNLVLTNDKTRGISNVTTENKVSFNITRGECIVIVNK